MGYLEGPFDFDGDGKFSFAVTLFPVMAILRFSLFIAGLLM